MTEPNPRGLQAGRAQIELPKGGEVLEPVRLALEQIAPQLDDLERKAHQHGELIATLIVNYGQPDPANDFSGGRVCQLRRSETRWPPWSGS